MVCLPRLPSAAASSASNAHWKQEEAKERPLESVQVLGDGDGPLARPLDPPARQRLCGIGAREQPRSGGEDV